MSEGRKREACLICAQPFDGPPERELCTTCFNEDLNINYLRLLNRLATAQEYQLEVIQNQAGQMDRLHDVGARIATALEKMSDTGLSL